MRVIGNILWLLLGGFWLAFGYAVAGLVSFILIITIPFGIASFPEHAQTKGEMIKKADEAMFLIKGKQKDGILVAE